MDFTIASLSTVKRVLRLSITVSTGALPTAVSRCPSNSLFSSVVCMTYNPSETPKQSDRQYLLPVYQLLEIQHGMRIAQFGDQLLGFERRSKISGLPGRSLDRADCGLEPRFVVFRKEVAMFRGQFAGQVIQVGGPVDAAPALGEGGRDRSDPSNSRNNFFMWFLGLGLSVQFSDYFSIPCCKPPLNLQPSPASAPL